MPTFRAKKIPCQECRFQKRKCDGNQPCDRCGKFNLKCEYIMSYTPEDKEYMESVKESDLKSTISLLEDQISQIEAEMMIMRNESDSGQSTSSKDSEKSESEEEEMDILESIERACKRQKTTSMSHHDMSATITPWETSWDLTFQKGKVSLNTNITNYTELLDSLHHMMGAVTLATEIPSAVKTVVQQNTLLGVLNSLIRKKYGKSHCKFVAKSAHVFIAPPERANTDSSSMMVVQSPDSLRVTTWKLIRAYLQCQHFRQLTIHSPTFFNLCTNEIESPAVMALASNICTLRCKHLAACLSSLSLLEFGKFYYKRAKQLVSFDGMDLETYTAFTFIAIYAITFSLHTDMKTYIGLSDRLSHLLEDRYSSLLKSTHKFEKGEAIHFYRIRNHFRRVLTCNDVSIQAMRRVRPDNLPFCTLMHSGEGRWEMAVDDSPMERLYLRMENYILELQRVDQTASRHVKSPDIKHLVGLIGHCIEMSMRHWYNHTLPPEFKLTLPIFDADMPSDQYYATLQRECRDHPIPALTTLKLYEEFIIIGQAYLPRPTPDKSLDDMLLDYSHAHKHAHTVWDSPTHTHAKDCEDEMVNSGRLERVSDIEHLDDFDGTKEEFLSHLCHMLEYAEAGVSTSIIMTSLAAAFNTVRIIKYLRSRTDDCGFDVNVLMNTWRFLLNVCKLKQWMPEEILALMPRIQEKLRIISMIFEEELETQPHQGKMEDYMATVSYESGVPDVVEDDYEWVACPDA